MVTSGTSSTVQYKLEHAVAKLVEALRYKPEGLEFNSNGVIGIFH
jgi:hypothetical protein